MFPDFQKSKFIAIYWDIAMSTRHAPGCTGAADEYALPNALRNPTTPPHGVTYVQVLLLRLLDTWVDRFDNIGSPPARKLSALALCLLLPIPIPAILQRLPDVIAHITAVCFEVRPGPGTIHAAFETVISFADPFLLFV